MLNINQRQLSSNVEKQKEKIIRQIEAAYKKAPHFNLVMEVVYECLSCPERNLFEFIVNSLRVCCRYLGIQTPFVLSSQLDNLNELRNQDRVLQINIEMGASHYINPIGGTELYDKERFAENGLRLSFIKTRNVAYDQLGNNEFIPFLSIIDVMMFNSQHEITELLKEYDLY